MERQIKMKIVKGILIFMAAIVLLAAGGIVLMGKQTQDALSRQVNADISMSQVEDGTYFGSSDGGLVKVEVNVIVKDHKITDIQLIKHDNGMGKPAEAILDDMIAQNIDDVDLVSGATVSSKTIRNAVNAALQQGLAQ
jgi:uncharacterized protein with FMN-binding domain